MMNKKGHRPNLKAAHPGNKSAQKSGLNSPRQRAMEADKVRQALAKNPEVFFSEDEAAMYAELRAHSKLLAVDLAERGVTDRSGKQRRQAGTYLRTMHACLELSDRIQARTAAHHLKEEMENPWTEQEALERLCEIARNRSEPAAARIAAIKTLKQLGPAKPYDLEFYELLSEMSDDELERELAALKVPLTTDPENPPTEPQWLEHSGRPSAQRLIRNLAQEDEITAEHLHDLYELLNESLDLAG